MPACSKRFIRSRKCFSSYSLNPIRILIETGKSVAWTVVRAISSARSGFVRRAEPCIELTTLRAGQPMLISMASAPIFFTVCAASWKKSGFLPKSWTMSGRSDSSKSRYSMVLFPPNLIPSAEISSVTQIVLGASFLMIWRKAESVYPAIGARRSIGLLVFCQSNMD